MSTIKAIETHYAGHRFRSRLEARWAVFFDTLGIEWRYEDQGYVCSPRLTGGGWLEDNEEINYLPDFWLPELGVLAEVKGELTDDECVRLLDVAASLSSEGAGGCGRGPDVVLLGRIPRAREACLPLALHMHKGDLQAKPWNPLVKTRDCYDPDAFIVASDCGGIDGLFQQGPFDGRTPRYVGAQLLKGMSVAGLPSCTAAAYDKARKARFEHGERG